jgi:hypothetical protein
MVYGTILYVIAVALASAALIGRPSGWMLPLLAGAVAAFALGLYQRWWVRAAFAERHPPPLHPIGRAVGPAAADSAPREHKVRRRRHAHA